MGVETVHYRERDTVLRELGRLLGDGVISFREYSDLCRRANAARLQPELAAVRTAIAERSATDSGAEQPSASVELDGPAPGPQAADSGQGVKNVAPEVIQPVEPTAKPQAIQPAPTSRTAVPAMAERGGGTSKPAPAEHQLNQRLAGFPPPPVPPTPNPRGVAQQFANDRKRRDNFNIIGALAIVWLLLFVPALFDSSKSGAFLSILLFIAAAGIVGLALRSAKAKKKSFLARDGDKAELYENIDRLIAEGKESTAHSRYRASFGVSSEEADRYIENVKREMATKAAAENQPAYASRPAPVVNQAAGFEEGLPPILSEELRRLARGGRKLEAIRRYRDVTGCSLVEAKHFVESL